jgi:hypothetical protein
MITASLQIDFNTWLDGELSNPIPESVIAFNFNLAEPWSIEVVGCDSYSEEESDWACDESFRSGNLPFSLPSSEVGSTWEGVLEIARNMVVEYLERKSAGSECLRAAKAVAIGFVDGDLHRVLPK